MTKRQKLFRPVCLLAVLALAISAFTFQPQHITVWLAGDSTMADKQVKEFPETGWGMPFKAFFDSTVTVRNIARNGRSTKSFLKEGSWKIITDGMKAGDYVLIQFGHNDEVPTKKNATTPTEFHDNLLRFITEARAKQAIPVLITPVARRNFDKDGKVEGTHEAYSTIIRKLAVEAKCPLIDLDSESKGLLQQFGVENSKFLYNYIEAGDNPNYPQGRHDNTHFSEMGARRMAQIVLNDIKKLNLDLKDRIVKGSFPDNVPAQVR
ncbi:lysophospholipase L1-like esterase [Mucilaginibacter yixingensis]|uniref:Lysophospholipase L1-like esterase n=1 Tax=Mucilaginibacter yixingensis TaxID=1295612 RepID=A0A2T5JA94_9SPHI|nr:rhamnogalacturonan acetylesterase [Mucilaginibacter yixingensis]PTQ97000.1 lysophospholipase L1-like esterase [Mucilaginibacter yixingensis]